MNKLIENLKLYLKQDTVVIIDTCALESVPDPKGFLDDVLAAAMPTRKPGFPAVVVPITVMDEVRTHIFDTSKPQERAHQAYNAINDKKNGDPAFSVEGTDPKLWSNADTQIANIVQSNVNFLNLLVLTLDNTLTASLKAMDFSYMPKAERHTVTVLRPIFGSYLSGLTAEEARRPETEDIPYAAAFDLPDKAAAPEPSAPMTVPMVSAGTVLMNQRGRSVVLRRGTIPGFAGMYRTDEGNDLIVPQTMTTGIPRKLDCLMRQRKAIPIEDVPLQYPTGLLAAMAGTGTANVAAYTVENASGYTVTLAQAVPYSSRESRVKLAKSLTEAVAFAHKMGIVLGSLDPTEILVDPTTNRVKLSGAHHWQVLKQAAVPGQSHLNGLVSLPGNRLLSPAADSKPLGKLVARILEQDYPSPQLMDAVQAAAAGMEISARHLRRMLSQKPASALSDGSAPSIRLGICANPGCKAAGRLTRLRPGSALCPDCFTLSEGKPRICKDDPTHRFFLTLGDLEFYHNKGYPYPTRCPACRKRNKQQRAAAGAQGSSQPAPETGIPIPPFAPL